MPVSLRVRVWHITSGHNIICRSVSRKLYDSNARGAMRSYLSATRCTRRCWMWTTRDALTSVNWMNRSRITSTDIWSLCSDMLHSRDIYGRVKTVIIRKKQTSGMLTRCTAQIKARHFVSDTFTSIFRRFTGCWFAFERRATSHVQHWSHVSPLHILIFVKAIMRWKATNTAAEVSFIAHSIWGYNGKSIGRSEQAVV